MFRQIIFFITLTSLSLSSLYAETLQKSFKSKKIDTIEISQSSGNVRVEKSSGSLIHVKATKKKFYKGCRLTIERKDKTLVVSVKKKKKWNFNVFQACEVELTILIPTKLKQIIRSGSGDVSIQKTLGDIDFVTGSADITISTVSDRIQGRSGSGTVTVTSLSEGKSVDLKTGSGSITVNNSHKNLDLRSGSGDITIKQLKHYKNGEIAIRTGSGDATLTFPKQALLKTSFRSGSGSISSEFKNSEQSSFSVSMQSGSGSLKILKKIK